LSTGFASTTTTVAGIWNDALAEQHRSNESLAHDLRGSLQQFTDAFDQRSAELVDSVSARFEATASNTTQAWTGALAHQQALGEDLANHNQQALASAAATVEQHAASLVDIVRQSHEDLQTALESRDRERLTAWSESFGSMATALNERWEQASARAADRQREVCEALARTASDISAHTQAHASDTIAEISRLVQTASEAPKAAADVVAELRQKLSDSMVRDTAMLEERTRLLATLENLLDAVNHAATEQRASVDALIGTSADLLDRVGSRFTAQVEAEAGKLEAAATRVTVGAIEVASLGDAFGAAVQQFGESNQTLVARLHGIEAALEKSLARSDEQMAYYVAQAREVVDLSMLAQKQIIEDLQQLADQRASARTQAA